MSWVLSTYVYVCLTALVGVNILLERRVYTSKPACLCTCVCLSASVGVFIKQLGPTLAVARRRARQLHMAGKGTSQRASSEQAGQQWHGANLSPGLPMSWSRVSTQWTSLQNWAFIRWVCEEKNGCVSVGLCIGMNLAIRYVSGYRGYDSTMYCDTVSKADCDFFIQF